MNPNTQASRAIEGRALEVLQRYMSEPAARGILRRANIRRPTRSGAAGSSGDEVDPFLEAVLFGARLFVDERSRGQLEHELRRLGSRRREDDAPANRQCLPICDEHHARKARMLARRMADDAGASKLDSLRAATGLSELTRNVLMYAGSGEVTLEVLEDPRRIRMIVVDRGPGIENVDSILDGHYQSKTGLGRGISGTRRLADHFEIETSPSGTRICFEMKL